MAKPIHADGVQPAATEVGQSLAAAGSFVRLATRPFQSLALAGHLAFDWLDEALRKKFEGVPSEKIVEPPANVAGPLMLAAGFTSDNDATLRGLYAQLLATAMHAATRSKAHPAFVEILRQMTLAEALLLKPLAAASSHPVIFVSVKVEKDADAAPLRYSSFPITALANGIEIEPDAEIIALLNLERLGIFSLDFNAAFRDVDRYASIRESRLMTGFLAVVKRQGTLLNEKVGVLQVTRLGESLFQACLPATTNPTK